ncbi:F0F1 ATP synthase subunit epsilon [Actinacidiphila oryziradicis]|uniref:ATP synthase epsilon chain n=1 Tax=Actinacidiphila oryziradicis TaxID=2571141 RepID=A0A4U0SJC9_9ACTN|nr:F0F1 ATP synthase subunit epsilon [Actinacidiphila oryziradicis]
MPTVGAVLAELHVELVAADRSVWSGEATLVVARTESGDIGIMPGHQPLLGVLQSGPVTIRTSEGGTVVAAVHDGFISFADNKLSILAEIAELADEIDVARAERALERAQSDTDAAAERRAEVRLAATTGVH